MRPVRAWSLRLVLEAGFSLSRTSLLAKSCRKPPMIEKLSVILIWSWKYRPSCWKVGSLMRYEAGLRVEPA